MPSTSSPFTFYNKQKYLHTIIREVEHAKRGDRALVMSMNFEIDGPLIAQLVDALCAAAERGAAVYFGIDARDFISDELKQFGPLWFHRDFPAHDSREPFRSRIAAVRRLRAADVTCGISNQPHRRFSVPVRGRSHIKAAVFNDKLFVGGCNLWKEDQLDMMVGWHSRQDANWLFEQLSRLVETETTRQAFGGTDLVHAVGGDSQLLIDAGVPDQSIIFDRALALIDEAQQWLILTCQFFPHGKTAKHLAAAAERGVQVRLIFNNPRKHSDFLPLKLAVPVHYAVGRRARRHVPAAFFKDELTPAQPYLHTKFLASERSLMLGSHNFVEDGVKFGTAEIALQSNDPAIGRVAALQLLQEVGLGGSERFSFLQ